VDSAQRELSDQIDQATQRLLDRARIITEPDLRAPSLLPGWTRARVLAHVTLGADAMRDLLAAVRDGQDRPGPSAEAHAAGLDHAEEQRPEQLVADLADSAMALRTVARRLPDDRWQALVQVPGLTAFPAAELLIRRLVEVELHHSDLGTGYSPAGWPSAFADMGLPEPMRSWREDRLGYPTQPQPALAPPRPPAPWNPGRPLPGSWLGTR